MTVKNYIELILSASYWRYRRQHEDHTISIFWVKLVFAFLFPMWGLLLTSLLFQKVDVMQSFREEMSQIQTAFFIILWLAGWWVLHRFIQANPSIYTLELEPENYRTGNIYAILLLTSSVGMFGYTLTTLGNM
ncbi:hypothetical protein [Hymenobacter antarcticus]|uniref:hypothetical protein n=1 Tax=Hymenobacter antarcticus TaxID=486270 RepID=UPI0031E57161